MREPAILSRFLDWSERQRVQQILKARSAARNLLNDPAGGEYPSEEQDDTFKVETLNIMAEIVDEVEAWGKEAQKTGDFYASVPVSQQRYLALRTFLQEHQRSQGDTND